MENNKNKNSAIKNKLKELFTKNIAIKIVSLCFAVLLWGYVMMTENPDREKQLNNVNVSFEGEADLIARRLVVRGDRQEILKAISVKVKTTLDKYSDLDATDISATINLNSVSYADTYELEINATTNNGVVLSKTPSSVTVEIDDLVTRVIPLEVVFEGTLPEGYWAGEPTLGRTELTIEGPATDLSKIIKGVCRVNLTDRTESFNESKQVELVDADGNTIDSSVLLGQLPSVTVKLEILKSFAVPVNVQDAILGEENLPLNYEVKNIRVSPESVNVAGTQDAINALDMLEIESVDISGRTESLLTELAIDVPEGIKLLDGDTVEVYIEIKERTESVAFQSIPIEVKNMTKGLNYTLEVGEADILFSGRVSIIKKLERNNVGLYVDVSGLSAGEYTLDVQVQLPDDEYKSELTWELTAATAKITLKG